MFEFLKKIYKEVVAACKKITAKKILKFIAYACLFYAGIYCALNWPLVVETYATYVPELTSAIVEFITPTIEFIFSVAFLELAVSALYTSLFMGYMALLCYSTMMDISNKTSPNQDTKGSTWSISKFFGLQRPKIKPPMPMSEALKILEKKVAGYKSILKTLVRHTFNRDGNPNKGFILFGPPGSGKTNIANGIAELCGEENVSIIYGPAELNSKWFGETEKNVQNLFNKAKRDPSNIKILIINEFDSIFGKRSDDSSGTRNEIMNAVVGQMLNLLDGAPKNLVLIATTNRLSGIDPAIMRAGRLGIQVEIPLPAEEDRLAILQHKFKDKTDSPINWAKWAKNTAGFTSSDFDTLTHAATSKALIAQEGDNHDSMLHFEVKNTDATAAVKLPITDEMMTEAFNQILSGKQAAARANNLPAAPHQSSITDSNAAFFFRMGSAFSVALIQNSLRELAEQRAEAGAGTGASAPGLWDNT